MKTIVIIDLHCDATMPAGAQEFGGGNVYSYGLLQHFIRDKLPCVYITRKKYPHLKESVPLSDTVSLIRLDLGDFGPDDVDLLQEYYPEALRKIKAILDEIKTEIILHSCYWQSGYVAMQLAAAYGLEYVHTIFSNGKRVQKNGALCINRSINERIATEDVVFRHSKALICSSEAEMQDMQELYQIPKEHLLMTGLPVHSAFEYPIRMRDGRLRINPLGTIAPQYLPVKSGHLQSFSVWKDCGVFLYFGRLAPIKGVPNIISAWLRLRAQNGANTPPLWIAGGSMDQIAAIHEQLDKDSSAILRAEKEGALLWWGNQGAEGISTLMTKSLVVVTHSQVEAGGLMILEAMAHRLPVIATPCGYACSCIHNWKEGFLVEYDNVDLLACRMEHFARQPLLSVEMGQAAYQTYQRTKGVFQFWEKHLFSYGLLKELPPPQIPPLFGQHEVSDDEPPLSKEYIAKFAQHVYEWDGPVVVSLERGGSSYHLWRLENHSRSYLCKQWRSVPCKEVLWHMSKTLVVSAASRVAAESVICPWNGYYADTNKNLTIFQLPKKADAPFSLNESLALLDQICTVQEVPDGICLRQVKFLEDLDQEWERLFLFHIPAANSLRELWRACQRPLAEEETVYRSVGAISEEMFYGRSLLHFGSECSASFGYSQASLLLFAHKRYGVLLEDLFASLGRYDPPRQKSILRWMLCLSWEDVLRSIVLDPYKNIWEPDIAFILAILERLKQYDNSPTEPKPFM